jgi:hypothetical protein
MSKKISATTDQELQPSPPFELPILVRVILIFSLLGLLGFSIFVILRYLADPTLASPKELGIPSLLLFSLVGLVILLVPWDKLGLRIKKIGAVEFEQVVLTQRKEQAEALDSLSQRIEKVERVYIPKTETEDSPIPRHELEDLLMKFFAKYPKTAFSPWRIQTWGAQREGFNRLSQYSRITIRQYLDRLLVEGKLETVLSRKGNTLYRLANAGENSFNQSIEETR